MPDAWVFDFPSYPPHTLGILPRFLPHHTHRGKDSRQSAKLFASFHMQLPVIFTCVKDLKWAGQGKVAPGRPVMPQAEEDAYTDELGDEE